MATKVFTGALIDFVTAIGLAATDWGNVVAPAWIVSDDVNGSSGGVSNTLSGQLLFVLASAVDDSTVPPVITMTAARFEFDYTVSADAAMALTDGVTFVTIPSPGAGGHFDATEDPTTYFGGTDRATLFAGSNLVWGFSTDGVVVTTTQSIVLSNFTLTITYSTPGSLDSLSPTFGPSTGGTLVTLTGSGFTGATQVTFDGVDAVSVSVVNDTTMTCLTPAHAAGPVDVEVVGVGTLADGFTYTSVTSINPESGPVAGGTLVTFTGSGFNATTGVTFDGLAATFTIVSDTSLTAISPAHAVGPVTILVAGVGVSATFTYILQSQFGKLPPIPRVQ